MSDGKYIDSPPDNVEGWGDVWRAKREYRARVAPAFFASIARFFERFLHPLYARQRDFNIVVSDVVRDARSDIAALRRDYTRDLEELRRDMQKLFEMIPTVAQRNDALIAALDQKIEALASRTRDLSLEALQGAATSPSFKSDFIYRRMEDALRGSSSDLRESMQHYVTLARDHQPVIDLGCGRGEFLAMCREGGVNARGFDSNERSVAELKSKGLDVSLEPIPGCMAGLGDGSIGMIFASHVVEHLPFDLLVEMFSQSARVLRSGGLLAIETPNAESFAMSASDFWRDPTHIAPRHVAALTSIAREFGFAVHETAAIHDYPAARTSQSSAAELYGPQDLRAVFRRS